MANEKQKAFLLDIGCRNLPDEDGIVWFVENILTTLSEIDCELLKAKYGLAGGYTDYTNRELAAIFKLSVEEFKTAFAQAQASAKIVLHKMRMS